MSGPRIWTVLYRDTSLHLTQEEYARLQAAADDEPADALRMADEFLAREASAADRRGT